MDLGMGLVAGLLESGVMLVVGLLADLELTFVVGLIIDSKVTF